VLEYNAGASCNRKRVVSAHAGHVRDVDVTFDTVDRLNIDSGDDIVPIRSQFELGVIEKSIYLDCQGSY